MDIAVISLVDIVPADPFFATWPPDCAKCGDPAGSCLCCPRCGEIIGGDEPACHCPPRVTKGVDEEAHLWFMGCNCSGQYEWADTWRGALALAAEHIRSSPHHRPTHSGRAVAVGATTPDNSEE